MKKDRILKYYSEWLNGFSFKDIARITETHKSYVYKVLFAKMMRDKEMEIQRIANLKKAPIKDAPKFWNPEDEIR